MKEKYCKTHTTVREKMGADSGCSGALVKLTLLGISLFAFYIRTFGVRKFEPVLHGSEGTFSVSKKTYRVKFRLQDFAQVGIVRKGRELGF